MNDNFPIQIPDRLPVRIEPCPIVEAIFETRFVSPEPWTTMPGLLFAQIREKYSEQKTLPVAQVPEELRRQDPALIHLPLSIAMWCDVSAMGDVVRWAMWWRLGNQLGCSWIGKSIAIKNMVTSCFDPGYGLQADVFGQGLRSTLAGTAMNFGSAPSHRETLEAAVAATACLAVAPIAECAWNASRNELKKT